MDVSAYSASFIGGLMIGLAAVGMIVLNGRIAGVSGILSQAITEKEGRAWRIAFVIGLIVGAGLFVVTGQTVSITIDASWPMIIAAGLLVGFGTRLGSGCTSGHGICGLARFSVRSLTATLLFMGSGMVTVWLVRHVIGGH